MPRRVRTHTNPLKRFPDLAPPAWGEVFADPALPLVLEFGSAKGEFLAGHARLYPRMNILGVEVRKPLAEAARADIAAAGLVNAGVIYGNIAGRVAEFTPRGRVEAVYVFFPDPWFKKRHAKRRLVQPELLAELAAVMPTGAAINLLTDQEVQRAHITAVFDASPFFRSSPFQDLPLKSAWQEYCDRTARPYHRFRFERR